MTRRTEGRALTAAEQLKVLARVWRNDRDGYVFLPWIRGDSATKEARRKNYHEGRAYLWPKERGAILEHLRAHQGDDLYFCPNLFNGKRRQEELVYAEMCLYADLDAVDPRQVRADRRPTLAWESSPGRFQGIWLLGGMREGATWPGGENQRLTYELGADLSGWDATQLLRVPGKPNHKHEYVEANGGKPVDGRLLWDNGPRYQWDDFDDLPVVGVVEDETELLDDELLDGIDRHEVWARVRMRCSSAVRRYMSARSEADAADVDRSDVLWQIERDLADAGCTLAEIVAVVRPTVWNKYRDRNDELRRLKTEAAKALKERPGGADGSGALEASDEVAKPRSHTTVADLFEAEVPRPRWLVRGVWPEGGCGFVAGEPKTYKSWLAMDLAVSLATGRPFLGEFPVVGGPRRVLYLQQEDSKSLVKDRLSTVIDGRSEPHHPHGKVGLSRKVRGHEGLSVTWEPAREMALFTEIRTGFLASDQSWQGWLEEYVRDERIALVVVDTLFTSAGNVDLDRAGEVMSRMLRPMSAIADKHNCAFVVVHHNKKNGGGGDAGDRRAGKDMLGSTAMHAWVDSALYVRSRTDLERLHGFSVEVPGAGGGVGGFAGIAGVELMVERETKVAEEMRFRVGVPRMVRDTGSNDDGSDGSGIVAADRWMPLVTMGWRKNQEADEDGKMSGNGSDRKRGHDGEGRGGGGGRKGAGRLIVERLREIGVTAARGRTVEEISEVLDVTVRTVSRQLRIALDREEVVKRGDHWYVSGEG